MARHGWKGRAYRDLRENSDLLAQEDVHLSSNKRQPKQVLSAEAQAWYTFALTFDKTFGLEPLLGGHVLYSSWNDHQQGCCVVSQ